MSSGVTSLETLLDDNVAADKSAALAEIGERIGALDYWVNNVCASNEGHINTGFARSDDGDNVRVFDVSLRGDNFDPIRSKRALQDTDLFKEHVMQPLELQTVAKALCDIHRQGNLSNSLRAAWQKAAFIGALNKLTRELASTDLPMRENTSGRMVKVSKVKYDELAGTEEFSNTKAAFRSTSAWLGGRVTDMAFSVAYAVGRKFGGGQPKNDM